MRTRPTILAAGGALGLGAVLVTAGPALACTTTSGDHATSATVTAQKVSYAHHTDSTRSQVMQQIRAYLASLTTAQRAALFDDLHHSWLLTHDQRAALLSQFRTALADHSLTTAELDALARQLHTDVAADLAARQAAQSSTPTTTKPATRTVVVHAPAPHAVKASEQQQTPQDRDSRWADHDWDHDRSSSTAQRDDGDHHGDGGHHGHGHHGGHHHGH